jgi:hypothetical protein
MASFQSASTFAAVLEHKLLVRSGDKTLFAHDLVRAFFAANHFLSIWQDDEVWKRRPDRNWIPMIEFCVSEFGSEKEIDALLNRLTSANVNLAGEVFRLLKKHRPELVATPIEDKFLRQYAETALYG